VVRRSSNTSQKLISGAFARLWKLVIEASERKGWGLRGQLSKVGQNIQQRATGRTILKKTGNFFGETGNHQLRGTGVKERAEIKHKRKP